MCNSASDRIELSVARIDESYLFVGSEVASKTKKITAKNDKIMMIFLTIPLNPIRDKMKPTKNKINPKDSRNHRDFGNKIRKKKSFNIIKIDPKKRTPPNVFIIFI